MNGTENNKPAAGGTLAVATRLLARAARGQFGHIAGGLALLLVSAAVALLQPWPLKIVLDSIVSGRPAPLGLDRMAVTIGPAHPKMALLVILCLGLVLIQLVMGVLTIISTRVLVSIGLGMVFRLRCALFNHIQKLSLRFHDTTTVGDSLYRVTWDSYCAQSIFNSGLIPALTALVTLTGIAGFMIWREWLLLIVALAVCVPLALLVRWMDRPMSEHSMRVQERESEISSRVQETLTGIRAVKAFGRESFESERFRAKAESSLRASLRLTVLQTGSQAIVGLVLATGTALVIGISAWRGLGAGDVVLMVSYMAMLFKPLETLAYTAALVQGAAAGARRVFAVLDRQPDVTDAPNAVELAGRAKGNLALDDVSFGYREGQLVLRGITLGIPANATVALVGPSGAGKTTLVSLLMRFYDPAGGRISLDGHDLRKLTLASLRRNIALVLQEPVLFAATIAENIAYGLPNATEQQVQSAARAAGAHEFIQSLPQGYETQIGERGVSLSGGQRQRLSIARAFLKDAPILIMDEPTSALDAETESHLLEAMERLKAGRTTIIIAHRLSTIRAADMIVVMQNGAVVEQGNHAELVSRGQLYARLHAMQFGAATAAGSGL